MKELLANVSDVDGVFSKVTDERLLIKCLFCNQTLIDLKSTDEDLYLLVDGDCVCDCDEFKKFDKACWSRQFVVWRHMTGCPDDMSPREWAYYRDGDSTILTPPDRTKTMWLDELAEIAKASGSLEQSMDWWCLVGGETHPTGRGYEFTMDGMKCVHTKRIWDNNHNYDPEMAVAAEQLMRMSCTKLDTHLQIVGSKSDLRRVLIVYSGLEVTHPERYEQIINLLDPIKAHTILGDDRWSMYKEEAR